MTSRRVFLSGSAATLVAVPVLLPERLGVPWPFAEQALAGAAKAPSPLARELKRELQNAVKAMAAQGRGEGARRVGLVLRLWAAHGVAQGYDAALRDGLARGIARHGRDAFLYGQPTHEKMREEHKGFGIPERLLPGHAALDPALRAKSLDLLLREGITPSMLRSADWFELTAGRMDRQFTQPVRRDDYIDCHEMKNFMDGLCDMAYAVCYFAGLFPNPLTADACAAAGGACAGAILAYYMICGWRNY